MDFEFSTSTRIIFGFGTASRLMEIIRRAGVKPFLFSDSMQRAEPILGGLAQAGLPSSSFLVDKEPDIDSVTSAAQVARETGGDCIVALGGGSVLDTGKAVAALATNPGDLLDYLENVGAGKDLQNPSIPLIAVPTTSGTGSEVTRNAVITIPGRGIKVSLRSHFLYPHVAVIDPVLAATMPPAVTASTGMDALSHLIESFVCNHPSPLVDALCRDGLGRASRSLIKAYVDGSDMEARQEMSLVSLFGGMALANARLGAVHGFAGVLGGMYSVPHGSLCAGLLPSVMEMNIHSLMLRHPESRALSRYAEIGQLLTGDSSADGLQGAQWVADLTHKMSIPSLSEHGVNQDDYPQIISRARDSNSMKGNPVLLSDNDLEEILQMAI